MCRELENVGLRVPEYHCNAFMLQTVIYNANAKKLAIGVENPAIGDKNPAIRVEKPDFKVEKLTIEYFSQIISKQKYTERTIEKLLFLYSEIDTNQIFGAPEIERILSCSITTSKEIMKKLRDMGVVVEVKGKGKGKYRFVNENE